eukprot:1005031-Prymnesium_polylepis.1
MLSPRDALDIKGIHAAEEAVAVAREQAVAMRAKVEEHLAAAPESAPEAAPASAPVAAPASEEVVREPSTDMDDVLRAAQLPLMKEKSNNRPGVARLQDVSRGFLARRRLRRSGGGGSGAAVAPPAAAEEAWDLPADPRRLSGSVGLGAPLARLRAALWQGRRAEEGAEPRQLRGEYRGHVGGGGDGQGGTAGGGAD